MTGGQACAILKHCCTSVFGMMPADLDGAPSRPGSGSGRRLEVRLPFTWAFVSFGLRSSRNIPLFFGIYGLK